jgi:MORN repeat variant
MKNFGPKENIGLFEICLWLFGLLGFIVAVFVYGNPQWNRFIYIFRQYVMKIEMKRPEHYTGVQKGWFPNGRLGGEAHFVKGELNGKMTSWYPSGKKQSEQWYLQGSRRGKWTNWDEKGNVLNQCEYRNGEPWEGLCYIYDMKAWQAVYKDGKPWRGYLSVQLEETGRTESKYYIEGKECTKEVYYRAEGIPADKQAAPGLGYFK